MNLLFVALFAFYAFLSWKNFRVGFWLLLLFLPFYSLRFTFFGLPSTLLEGVFLIWAFIWLIKFFKEDKNILFGFWKEKRYFNLAIFLFLAFALVGVFNNPGFLKGLGIWRAYFLEPVVLFYIIIARRFEIEDVVWGLIGCSIPVSVLSIFQMFTGWGIYTQQWAMWPGRRVTAFFTSPNAVGLFLEMIFLINLVLVWYLQNKYENKKRNFAITALVLNFLAIVFSFSQGAWLAIAAGIILFLFLMGYKKSVIALVAAGILVLAFLPMAREVVTFSDRAGKNRLILWQTTQEYLFSSPTHFVLGAGLRRFYSDIQKPLANVVMEPLIYPHNIILNFWSEIGLFGLVSFLFIFISLWRESFLLKQKNRMWSAIMVSVWLVFLVHGLVDVPYFKNDLSFLFWIFAGLTFLFNSYEI
ncbi:MAG TPA: O-antigen ligase family protein [Candidatus Magasanikbacteria bacterium]|nr:O-antigen ligase family protein [Candidatus Magasanikbacteria bacterium]